VSRAVVGCPCSSICTPFPDIAQSRTLRVSFILEAAAGSLIVPGLHVAHFPTRESLLSLERVPPRASRDSQDTFTNRLHRGAFSKSQTRHTRARVLFCLPCTSFTADCKSARLTFHRYDATRRATSTPLTRAQSLICLSESLERIPNSAELWFPPPSVSPRLGIKDIQVRLRMSTLLLPRRDVKIILGSVPVSSTKLL